MNEQFLGEDNKSDKDEEDCGWRPPPRSRCALVQGPLKRDLLELIYVEAADYAQCGKKAGRCFCGTPGHKRQAQYEPDGDGQSSASSIASSAEIEPVENTPRWEVGQDGVRRKDCWGVQTPAMQWRSRLWKRQVRQCSNPV